jgi:hypothetical protein
MEGSRMPADRFINDAGHWRDRANEMRALAASLNDHIARATMLRIADDYDNLASRARLRVGGTSSISDEAAIGDDPESRGDPYTGSAK